MKKSHIVLGIGLLLAAALIGWTVSALYVNTPATPEDLQHTYALLTLGVLVTASYFFITEAIPIAMTALFIPCYYSVFGIMSRTEAFSGLVDSSVILFGGMFVVGGAMFQTGLAQKIGFKVVALAKGSQVKTILGISIVTGILSAFLSNTGTVAVLLPVCLGIADSQGWNRAALLFPLALMASSGGMITLVGTPPNMSAWTTLNNAGYEFGFFDFAALGVPVAIMTIVYVLTLGKKFIPCRSCDVQVQDEEKDKVYDVKKQWVVGIIMVTVILIMVTEVIDLATAAILGGLACVVTGCLTEKQAYRSIDFQTIFLFAGALGLANAMKVTGAGEIIANAVVTAMGTDVSPHLLVAVLFLLAGTLTQVMSNTAAAALLCPIGLSIASALNANPTAVVLAIGFACSAAYVTPMATPPNTMVYGPGGLRFMDYVKVGGPLFLLVGVLAVILLPALYPFF